MTDLAFFKSLDVVRLRTSHLLRYPQYLECFDLNLSKLDSVVEIVLGLINRDYSSPQDIPMHSRWRHFEAKPINGVALNRPPHLRINDLIDEWKAGGVDIREIVKRLCMFLIMQWICSSSLFF